MIESAVNSAATNGDYNAKFVVWQVRLAEGSAEAGFVGLSLVGENTLSR